MDASLNRALIGLTVVAPVFLWSLSRLRLGPTVGAKLQIVGSVGLLVVVAAHICEALQLFPAMGWGRPNTVGHYLDLASATVGVTFIPIGYILSRLAIPEIGRRRGLRKGRSAHPRR